MRKRLLAFGCWLLTISAAFAGVVGSIRGRVTDKATGEPLVGASVMVVGTELGAATDFNGQYQIINIPPGKYSVTASYVGYDDMTVTDVLVIQDNATDLNFKLSKTVIKQKEVVVTASKPMVQRQAVSVERVIVSEDFKRLPVTDIREIVGLQAGVTQTRSGGWTHIRGGRYDDVSYLVDGVAAQDALVGTLWSSPKPTTDALASVVVITGGFDAEYGSAMSGIIKAVTKEGGATTQGRVRLLTDAVFPNPDLNFGYNRLSFSIGGPTPYNRLRYFLSTEYFRTDDDRNCLYKVNAPRKEYAAEGKLTLSMPKSFFLTREGLKFTLDGHHSNYQWQAWANSYKYYQRGLYANRVRSYKANFTVNHMLSPTTVYEAKLGMFMTSLIRTVRNFAAEEADTLGFTGFLRRTGIWDQYYFRAEDWVFDWRKYNEYLKRHGMDTLAGMDDAVLNLWRSFWLYVSPDGKDTIPVYGYPDQGKNFMQAYAMTNYRWGVPGLFVDQGNERTWHYRATNDYLFKFDLTKTISKIHEIKTGVDITQYSLSMYDNSLPWDQNPFWDAYNYKPLVAAAYLQDRADFEDLVVRAGVRLDYLDSKAEYRVFPESLGSRPEIADSFVPVKPKFRVSPRLGISYPITERIKFRFSYGHFFKNPAFSNLYEYGGREAAELRGRGNIIVGNPDMSAEKTIAYELGLDAQLTDIFAFDFTAFYKDVFDLSGVRIVHALPQPYSMYYNVEYARIQGFEATMSKQLANYWSASAGYTFQIAKGTASTAYDQYQRETPLQIDYFLDQDQRHAFHANLGISFPSDFGFVPARDFEASAVFNYASGMPYTPTDLRGNRIGAENSGRMPGATTIDGRLSKDLKLAGLTLSLSCDVSNLLNAKVVNNVYSATGKPDDDGRRITPYEFSGGIAFGDLYYHPARDYNHDGYLTRMEMYESYVRAYEDRVKAPTYYGASRKIRFGISLSF
ncbi:MAG: TonB-dependent receptor [candidate division WOR-3 bacterium]